jgi:hypothetical protein
MMLSDKALRRIGRDLLDDTDGDEIQDRNPLTKRHSAEPARRRRCDRERRAPASAAVLQFSKRRRQRSG